MPIDVLAQKSSFRIGLFVAITASALATLGACSSDSTGNTDDSATSGDGGTSGVDGGSSSDTSTSNGDGGSVSDASAPTDAGVPTGAPAAPTELRMVLQGQNGASQTASPPTPINPNRLDIAWTAATAGAHPVNHYKVYRSTDGST